MDKDKILLETLELQKKFIENNFTPIIVATKESYNTIDRNRRKDLFSKLGEEIREYQTSR